MRNIEYIWSIDERKLSPSRRWGLRTMKRIFITVECIMKNNIMSFASALTYSSILAAVPVLAIVFAVARGFGFGPLIESHMKESLQVSPEITDTIFDFVDSYLKHTHEGVFIGAGLLFLLYTLIALTSNIETAFNTIWYVRNSRNFYRKITDYISVFVLLPFVIVLGTGINAFLMAFQNWFPDYQTVNHTVTRIFQFSPSLLTCLAFTLLYKLMPNTQVKLKNTLWPGLIAGIAFMVVQYFYIHYQIKLSSYNAIYGSFAALPLCMLWLHISWVICLIGGQLCYANQCLDNYAFERYSDDLSRRYRDTISLLLMTRICKRFASGSIPYTEKTLAQETKLPDTLVRVLLEELVNMQLLAETHDETGAITHYLPAVDIHRMTLRMVMKKIDSHGSEVPARSWQVSTEEWEKLRRMRNLNEDALLADI